MSNQERANKIVLIKAEYTDYAIRKFVRQYGSLWKVSASRLDDFYQQAWRKRKARQW